MTQQVTIAYSGEAGREMADLIRVELAKSGLADVASPQELEEKGGKLGPIEVLLTIVVFSAAKAAIGMAFDALEKALLEVVRNRRAAARIQLELKNGESEESRRIPLILDSAADKGVSFAVRTAREIAESWL